jgi:hypothetical protein
MKRLSIDFNKINSKEKLYDLLGKRYIQYLGSFEGYNLSSFKDLYEYSDEVDFLELHNLDKIIDESFKGFIIEQFLWVLSSLKKTNPNFDYKIIEEKNSGHYL